jgi:hypothetical protein
VTERYENIVLVVLMRRKREEPEEREIDAKVKLYEDGHTCSN